MNAEEAAVSYKHEIKAPWYVERILELEAKLERYEKMLNDSADKLMDKALIKNEFIDRCLGFRDLADRYHEEVYCLRSVLSEWEQDKTCYLQWNRAEELRMNREGK
jgi:hypothetical protein